MSIQYHCDLCKEECSSGSERLYDLNTNLPGRDNLTVSFSVYRNIRMPGSQQRRNLDLCESCQRKVLANAASSNEREEIELV